MSRFARVSVLWVALSLVACSPRAEPAASVDAGGGQGDEPDVVMPGGDCEDDSDCSYNGTCEEGLCACHTPWQGSVCARLEMGVVDKAVYGYREGFPYPTSWGGSAQYDEASDRYVMLVSEYVEECANWGWNSTVVVATSVAPEGPYEREFRLFGVMSHEAMLARGPEGEGVVYFTASRAADGLPATGDSDYSDDEVCVRTAADEPCECPGDPDKGSKDPTWMSHTLTPLEPETWSEPVLIFDPASHFTDTFADGTPAESIDANLNAVILDDGTVVGLWRTWQKC